MKKRMRHLLALALSVVTLAGTVGVLPAEAAASNEIVRVGNKDRTTYVGKEIELKVNEGSKVKEKHMKWAVADSSILAFEDGDRYGDDMEFKAKKAGTTTVICKNLLTGKYVFYKVTVKAPASSNYMRSVGKATKTVEVGDDIELKVTKGSGVKESQIKWSIDNTSILRFEDGSKYGSEVEVEGRKIGTTKVRVTNLKTGAQAVYTVKVVRDND